MLVDNVQFVFNLAPNLRFSRIVLFYVCLALAGRLMPLIVSFISIAIVLLLHLFYEETIFMMRMLAAINLIQFLVCLVQVVRRILESFIDWFALNQLLDKLRIEI